MKIRYLLIAIFISLFLFLLFKYAPLKQIGTLNNNLKNTPISSSQKVVSISGKKIYVEIADTRNLQTKGLSGRTSLAKDHGMLFIFPSEARQFFWMKDMLFPIDIIWINRGGEIVYIDKNVPIPEANTPDYKLPIYSSPKAVKYVLEVNAGFGEAANIKIGDRVEINI